MEIDELYEILEGHEPGRIGRFREFSVLIPIIERGDDINLLYQVRGSDIKRQPGEISFPGGAKENGENNLQCAVRETAEELKINISEITDIREIATQRTWSGDEIHIFAGVIGAESIDRFVPNVEVAEIFEVPMEWLLSYEPEIHMASAKAGFEDDFDETLLGYPEGYPWVKLKSEQPMYYFEGRIIWGITGRITKYFIDLIKG